jgi:signal recognition particle subunit SRP54
MVLEELGQRITNAFIKLQEASVVDEKTFQLALNSIGMALLKADVNILLVKQFQTKLQKSFATLDVKPGVDRRKFLRTEIVREIRNLLDCKRPIWMPDKRKCNVIMTVGLQGSGKTTTCAKLAYRYKSRGWRVGLVCADTFRAGAFDQLKQNAVKQKIPFYGSYTECDPVVVADQGVRAFQDEKMQIIIVDTSGRHKQDTALFSEMQTIAEHVRPDQVIFVMDGTIGQAAKAQSEAFAQAISIGSIILTKLDGHGKGGGSLTAVASTGAPIAYIGTGEHIGDLEDFTASGFIGRLLGIGDVHAMERLFMEDQGMEEFMRQTTDAKMGMHIKMMEGKMGELTIRDYQQQMQIMTTNSTALNLVSLMPGMGSGAKMEDQKKSIAETLTIIDSMTEKEKDSSPNLFLGESGASRIRRIARGSGKSEERVKILIRGILQMVTRFKKHDGKKNMNALSVPAKGLVAKQRQGQQIQKLFTPQQLQMFGGVSGFQNLMAGIGGDGLMGGMPMPPTE